MRWEKQPLAILAIKEVRVERAAATVQWELGEGRCKYLTAVPFELGYRWRSGEPLDFGERGAGILLKCAAFSLLSLAVPLLALDHRRVMVRTPFGLSDDDVAYWRGRLERLRIEDCELVFESDGVVPEMGYLKQADRPDRVGLFYGGGVESNMALSVLAGRNPLLFVVEGPWWMNNNTEGCVSVKRDLERRLCERHGFEMVYAHMNARSLSQAPEPLNNHYCTGGLFYWLAAAAGLRLGLGQFYIGQEMEDTLIGERFDLSLRPWQYFWGWHPQAPMMVSILGWLTKIQLFERLKETEFLEYVYSCNFNTERRWCGKCPKCHKISDACRRFGVPFERIGMEGPVEEYRKGIHLLELYWNSVRHLYPEPGDPRPEPLPVPVTDITLLELCHQDLFEPENATVGFEHNRVTVTPGGGGEGIVRFRPIRLRGQDRFSCHIRNSGGKWVVSLQLFDQEDRPILRTERTAEGRGVTPWVESVPELRGRYWVELRVVCRRGSREQPPSLVQPVFSRATA